ncbi:MAG: hypothetical protein ACFFEA_01670 [Candidatus Thorarchaeota archaeon]
MFRQERAESLLAAANNYTIYKEGVIEDSSTWDGSAITIDVDGPSTGDYDYTIVVFDIGDNSVSDTVIVTVNEVETTTTTTTPTTATTPTGVVEIPFGTMLLIVGGLGGVIAIVLILVLLRRRGG